MPKSTNSSNSASPRIALSDSEKTDLQQLGELRWGIDRIASFFGWKKTDLEEELRNPDSEVRACLLRGELMAAYNMESRLLSDAKSGNSTAIKQFSDLVRDRSFKLTKLDLFGGSEDSIIYEHVQELIDKGVSAHFSNDEQLYIQALQMVYSLSVRFGDRKTVKLLTKPPFSVNYARAKEMLCEAVELFNAGRRTSKEAMRYHIAESYDTLYHAILETAKTPQELAMAAAILDKKAKLLQLDRPEIEAVKPEMFPRMYKFSSLTPESVGLPVANRDVIAAQIDALTDVPESEKEIFKMEGGVKDFDLIKLMDQAIEEED